MNVKVCLRLVAIGTLELQQTQQGPCPLPCKVLYTTGHQILQTLGFWDMRDGSSLKNILRPEAHIIVPQCSLLRAGRDTRAWLRT